MSNDWLQVGWTPNTTATKVDDTLFGDNFLGLDTNVGSTPLPTIDNTTNDWFSMEGAFGEKGWFSPTMQGVGALSNLWMGSKQLGLAEDSFKFNKGVMETNLSNQAQLANQQIRDRYIARLAMSGVTGDAAQQQADRYMQSNTISGQVGGNKAPTVAPSTPAPRTPRRFSDDFGG